MELDIMWKSRIENKVLLRQMGAGLVDTKRVLINNGKIKQCAESLSLKVISKRTQKGCLNGKMGTEVCM